MGNHISDHASGRVVLSDGTISKVPVSVTVGELMLDHPQQVVVEFQSLTNGRKPKPLPADTKLETNKDYMMLPMSSWRASGNIMASKEARRLLLTANVAYTGFLPLLARICRLRKRKQPAGGLSREITMSMETTEGTPDYYCLSRQLSGKTCWKPSLDTIKEKGTVKAKTLHCLL